MIYDSVDYALSRLKNTIVRLKNGLPFFVEDIDNNWEVYGRVFSKEKNKLTNSITHISTLDLIPTLLGFINCGNGGLSYVVRMPRRDYFKQGLSMNCLKVVWGDVNNFSDVDLCKTIMGLYPSKDDCLDITTNYEIPIAFNRNFAIHFYKNVYNIYYKFYGCVGIYKDNKINLLNKFSYLQELINKLEI